MCTLAIIPPAVNYPASSEQVAAQTFKLAYNFIETSLSCFPYWEFWSLGGSEDFYNLLRNSDTPSLPAAKAIIEIILIYIPVRSSGDGLAMRIESAKH